MNLPRKRTLSEQQTQFCEYLVKENKNPTEAARLAGYAVPKQSAYILTRNPTVMTALRLMRQTVYQTDMASLAANTLKEVMQDPDANPSAKVSAARTALELAGDLGKNAEEMSSGKNLGEMTPDELGSLIDRWEGERSNLAKDVTTPQKDEEDQ